MKTHRLPILSFVLLSFSITIEAVLNGISNHLGQDWLELNHDNNEQVHIRKKRVAGTSVDATNFTLVEVASQTISSSMVDIGDSFTFEVVVDLPGIIVANKSDMVIEIFGLDAESGVAGIHVCQAHEEDISGYGDNIKSIQNYPVYVNEISSHHKNFVPKMQIIREQLHTDGVEDVENGNKIQIQFQAVVVNAGLDKDWTFQSGDRHYITVGIQYGDKFLWVGQASFSVTLSNQDYDLRVNFQSGPIGLDKATFQKGKGYIFTIRANIVEPVADVTLQIFQPLGYNDVFHIGHVQKHLGNAFACSAVDGWQDTYNLAPSALTVNNASLFYSFLVNREAQRNVSNDANEVVFLVPIHVMNIDSLPPGANRMISFVLKIGKQKVWTTLEERIISEEPLPVSNGITPTLENVRLFNNVSKDQIPKGDGIVFMVDINCKKSAYCKLDVELPASDNGQPAIPVGARIFNGGTIAYFSPPWSVFKRQDENVILSFGLVENPADQDTTVSLELAYALDPTTDESYSIEFVNPKIGGLVVDLPTDLKASGNDRSSKINVEIDDFGFDDQVHIHGQVALELKVTAESGSGVEGLVLEAIPDLDSNHPLRICTMKIMNIGRGLPCVYHSHFKPKAEYMKSDETLPFYDMAKLKLDRICPYVVPHTIGGDNQFVARIVWESPTIAKETSPTFRVNGGLTVQSSAVWVASKSYNLVDASMNSSYAQGNHNPLPFVAAYPIVTTRGRNNSFQRGEGLFEKYILKFPPLARGAFNFVLKPSIHSRACKIKIIHIGENYPCTQPPGPVITGYENIEIQYDVSGNKHESELGEEVILKLKGITNWGRSPVQYDLTPDENALQFVVFYQIDPEGTFQSNASMDLSFELQDASNNAIIQSGKTIRALDPTVQPKGQRHLPTPNITVEFVNPAAISKGFMFKKSPNILRIHVPVPATMLGDMKVSLINVDFNSGLDLIHFCNLTLVEQGDNIPCVHPVNSVKTNNSDESHLCSENNLTLFKSINAYVTGICHFTYSQDIKENYMTFEASVLVLDATQEGKELSLKVVVESDEFEDIAEIDVTLPGGGGKPRVAEPTGDDIIVDLIHAKEVQVVPKQSNPNSSEIGENIWIGYNITVPRGKTMKIEAALLLPSESNRAFFHAVDVKFADCNGKNILCMNPSIDLQRTYPSSFVKSNNITTFMQADLVVINFGYVTNGGLSFKQGLYQNQIDDTFSVQFLVQKSDHQSWKRETVQPIRFSVKFGNVSAVVNTWIGFEQQKLKEEQGQMLIATNLAKPNKQYQEGDTINISSIIKHDKFSAREGYPTVIQIIVPPYLAYKEDINTFSSNYTTNGNENVTVAVTNPSTVYFQFSQGISFPDIVELNFSLTVEMEGNRPVGSGVESSSIVFVPICFHSGKDYIGDANSSVVSCGSLHALPFESSAPECLEDLVLDNPCQITASSTFDPINFAPHFVIPTFSNISTMGWAPALKTPFNSKNEFPDYLEFNFLSAARIGQISIHSETNVLRKVKTIQIQYGQMKEFLENWQDPVRVDLNPNIEINPPLEARIIRLTLVNSDVQDVIETPPGISRVEFKGCFPQIHQLESCETEDTPSKVFESFAIDDAQRIAYYCARLDKNGRAHCFGSDRRRVPTKWSELPNFVSFLIGYDQVSGSMLFHGQTDASCFKSVDGQRIVPLTNCSQLTTSPALIEAKKILRSGSLSPSEGTWTGKQKQYGGRLNGITEGEIIILQRKSCCF